MVNIIGRLRIRHHIIIEVLNIDSVINVINHHIRRGSYVIGYTNKIRTMQVGQYVDCRIVVDEIHNS